jgi:2-oxo-4-hydroxy-4-carboxy--5-ureidoimidazoline (OHCU) decarboxylase
MFYSRRRKVIQEIRRRVEDGRAKNERQAIDQLEQLRGARSLDWLCKNIRLFVLATSCPIFL